MTPRDVRRQRRDEVHHTQAERDERRESRQPVPVPNDPQRHETTVQPDPPGGCVAPPREDVAPVLGDHPAADGESDPAPERKRPSIAQPAREDDTDDQDP